MSGYSIDDFLRKILKPKYKNRQKLSPIRPFTFIISCHSGCCKTNFPLNLIFKYLHFNGLNVFARNLNKPYYEYLKEIDNELRDILGYEWNDHIKFYNSLDDVAALQAVDSSKQNSVVFDEFINEKDQSKICDYFTMGRKCNCFVIYISQSYYIIPRNIRLNTRYYALYTLRNKQDISQLKKELLSISNEEFQNILKKVTSKKYYFLFIDTAKIDDKLKYRINLGAAKNNWNKWKYLGVSHYRNKKSKFKKILQGPPAVAFKITNDIIMILIIRD